MGELELESVFLRKIAQLQVLSDKIPAQLNFETSFESWCFLLDLLLRFSPTLTCTDLLIKIAPPAHHHDSGSKHFLINYSLIQLTIQLPLTNHSENR
jgi:hypothetical protein